MRLASTRAAQQLLQDTMQSSGGSSSSGGGKGGGSSSSAATVTNYFEPAQGHIVPIGVEGKQPAANTVLQDTASFTYVAVIPDIPKERCKTPLKVRPSVEGTPQ
jgi:hypothetical protein